MSETQHERTYLAVPFGEKDEAKALGARWDMAVKSWYIPLRRQSSLVRAMETRTAALCLHRSCR